MKSSPDDWKVVARVSCQGPPDGSHGCVADGRPVWEFLLPLAPGERVAPFFREVRRMCEACALEAGFTPPPTRCAFCGVAKTDEHDDWRVVVQPLTGTEYQYCGHC